MTSIEGERKIHLCWVESTRQSLAEEEVHVRLSQILRVMILPLLAVSLVVAGTVVVRGSVPGTAEERQGFRIAATPGSPFNGTLLGVRFGPTDVLVRDGVQKSIAELCPVGEARAVDGGNYLPRPRYLPEGAVRSTPPGYPAGNLPNPFAFVCSSDGQLLRAALSYVLPSADGPPGEIYVVRVVSNPPYFPTTASREQIETVKVGSRQAVLIDTSTPAGLGLSGIPSIALVFPQPDGYLAVTSLGIPAEEALKIAGSLAMEDR